MATPCADTREFSRARGGGIGGQASMEAERGEAKDVEVFVFWTLWGRSSYAVVSFRLSFPTFPFSLAPGTHKGAGFYGGRGGRGKEEKMCKRNSLPFPDSLGAKQLWRRFEKPPLLSGARVSNS